MDSGPSFLVDGTSSGTRRICARGPRATTRIRTWAQFSDARPRGYSPWLGADSGILWRPVTRTRGDGRQWTGAPRAHVGRRCSIVWIYIYKYSNMRHQRTVAFVQQGVKSFIRNPSLTTRYPGVVQGGRVTYHPRPIYLLGTQVRTISAATNFVAPADNWRRKYNGSLGKEGLQSRAPYPEASYVDIYIHIYKIGAAQPTGCQRCLSVRISFRWAPTPSAAFATAPTSVPLAGAKIAVQVVLR